MSELSLTDHRTLKPYVRRIWKYYCPCRADVLSSEYEFKRTGTSRDTRLTPYLLVKKIDISECRVERVINLT